MIEGNSGTLVEMRIRRAFTMSRKMFAGFCFKLLKRLSCVDRVWKRVKDRSTFEKRRIKVELSPRYGVLNERGLHREHGVIRVPKETNGLVRTSALDKYSEM